MLGRFTGVFAFASALFAMWCVVALSSAAYVLGIFLLLLCGATSVAFWKSSPK
jgi:hypothetical protein